MAEDSEPRKARIRENLVKGIGRFEVMADIIVASQHAANNSDLFGIVQSPIRPIVRQAVGQSAAPSSTAEPHMTATEMARKMQAIDSPLSTIETNLPFKKNQDRKNNASKNYDPNMPSTSLVSNTASGSNSNNSEKPSTSTNRSDDNSCRKRKRRKSESNNADTENWQKPCTSSAAPVKMEAADNKMTINELFGEEKREIVNEKKRVPIIDQLKSMEKKILKQEEKESPDSGYEEAGNNNREQIKRPRLQSIIGEVSRISPLLTPPRQPQKSDSARYPVIMNLHKLESVQMDRVRNLYESSHSPTVAVPSCVLSPPQRPSTSTNEQNDTTALQQQQQPSRSERSAVVFGSSSSSSSSSSSPKPVPKTTAATTTIDNTSSNNSSNIIARNKKHIVHSAAATPSSASSAKDFKKESIPRCGSVSGDDQKRELAAVKKDGLKITLVKKFIKQHDKTYVTTSASSSTANSNTTTTATTTTTTVTSSTNTGKISEKRSKKDETASTVSSSNNEQLPSTSKQEKKSVLSKSSISGAGNNKREENANSREKERKKRQEREHSKEKEKQNATFRVKDSGKTDDQKPGSSAAAAAAAPTGTATIQSRDPTKKLGTNGVNPLSSNNGTSSNSNNSNGGSNTGDNAVTKSSKAKNNESSSVVKKYKKDTNSNKSSAASATFDGEQSGGFVCCRTRTTPTKKTALKKNEDGSYKSPTQYLDEIARPLKQVAEKESSDHVQRTLGYMESAVYFILSSATPSGTDCRENKQRQYNTARESAELMKLVVRWSSQADLTPLELHFVSRFKLLSSRIQAILNYYLYSLKTGSCMTNFGVLTKYEPHLAELDAAAVRNDGAASVSSQSGSSATNTATPSPASSTNSGVNGDRHKEISLPVFIYQTQRSQLSILHHLMWADRLWKQTMEKMCSADQEMVKHLDQLCGPLAVGSNLYAVAEYLATAVTWLRAEYSLEKASVAGAVTMYT